MEITSELSDLVAMQSKHTKFYILHQNLVTYLPVSKTLIEYNGNNFEENGEEEKEVIYFKYTE